MRKFTLFVLVAVVTVFLGAQERQTKLAVMEIDDQSGKLSKKLLETAAEALRTELVASNKFIVISKDRQRKAMIKGEKKESWKECYDQSCRIQLGQALTADNIMTGIVTYFGKKYTLTVEIIDLAKEATVKGAKAEFDGTEEGLADAIKSIAAQVTGVKRAGGGSSFKEGKIGEQVEDWEIGQGEETIVKFESKPDGAVVMVDGKILCQATPCSKMLTQGKHEITIQKENYLPKTKVFDIVKGRKPVSAELEPDFGYLSVESEPAGIEVLLDGKSIGKTPVEKVSLSPGAHQVETSDACYYQTGEKFTTKRGESKNLRLEAKPKEAGIKVSAQDKDGNDIEADVIVDDQKIGTTPGKYKIPLCSKELKVETGKSTYKENLSLKEKKLFEVVAILKSKERFEAKDEIVVDSESRLMWQRGNQAGLDREGAQKYCAELEIGKYSDWRLPTISELRTLIVGCAGSAKGGACKVTDTCANYPSIYSEKNCWSKDCYCKSGEGPGENGFYWQPGVWNFDYNQDDPERAKWGHHGDPEGWFWSSTKRADDTSWSWLISFGSSPNIFVQYKENRAEGVAYINKDVNGGAFIYFGYFGDGYGGFSGKASARCVRTR